MSATPARASRLVAASVAVYQTLLLLYPRRFHAQFAEPMALVFGDACRAAAREGRSPALARLWLATLADLLVSALAEHAEHLKEVPMTEQRSLSRAAGLAGLIGGALLLFYGAIGLLTLINMVTPEQAFYHTVLYDTRSALFLPVSWAPTLVAPLAWVCALVLIWGLTAWLALRGGWGAWLAGGVALLGALMGFLGSLSLVIGSWNSWYYWHASATAFESLIMGDPLPYLAALDIFGRMVVGVGLLGLALTSWRTGQAKVSLIVVAFLGALALIPYLYLYLAGPAIILRALPTGTQYGGMLPWTPFSLPFPAAWPLNVALWSVDTAFALVWGLGLLALGRRFLGGAVARAVRQAPALA
ncbi:MAG TPA: hypothetical protein VF725_06185 [Ktedonobacterales bacterium]